MKARLCGFGFWMPGYTDAGAWLGGAAFSEEAAKPKAALLASRLRRRTAPLTKMSIDVIQAAAAEANADLAEATLVLSSGWGEMETTIALLGQLAEAEPQLSPTLFHNSVHNTATGYLSIAVGNRHGSTAIGAGGEGLASAMVEAFCSLAGAEGDVIVAVADEAIPAPFDGAGGEPIAVGLCLRPHDAPGGIVCELSRGSLAESSVDRSVPDSLRANPSASVVPLCRALVAGGRQRIPLSPGVGEGWLLHLESETNT